MRHGVQLETFDGTPRVEAFYFGLTLHVHDLFQLDIFVDLLLNV